MNATVVVGCYATFLLLVLPAVTYFLGSSKYHAMKTSVAASIAVTLAIVLSCSFYFLIRLFLNVDHARWLMLFLAAVIVCGALIFIRRSVEVRQLIRARLIGAKRIAFGLSVILSIYFVVLSPYLFRNGLTPEGTLKAYELFATEGMFHATLVADLDHNVLPSTGDVLAVDRSYYHYFSNLFIHLFSSLGGAKNTFIVFVYFFVPCMLVVLALNIFALSQSLWNNISISFLSVCLSLFCYDSTAFMLWLRGLWVDHSWWFGTSYPTALAVWSPIMTLFQLFHNPSFLFSSALLPGTALVIERSVQRRSYVWAVLVTISLLFLIKSKITAFGIAFGGLFLWSLVLWREGNRRLFYISSIVGLLGFLTIFISSDSTRNGVEFSKWYFPVNFGIRAHLISEPIAENIRATGMPYSVTGVLNLILVMAVYYAGLLDFRWLAFVRWRSWWVLKRVLTVRPSLHTFIIGTCLSGGLAFVFIANAYKPYDAMWFFLGILFFMNLYVARAAYALWKRTAGFFRWALRGVLLLTLIIPSFTFLLPLYRPPVTQVLTLDSAELAYLEFLSHLPAGTRVLSRYVDRFKHADEMEMVVQAFSRQKVVTEGVRYVFPYVERDSSYLRKLNDVRANVEVFYQTADSAVATSLLRHYLVTHILLRGSDRLHFPVDKRFHVVYDKAPARIIRFTP